MQTPVNDVLISVIVPVYNAAAYLERCIDSLLQQDEVRFEAIFINDGSSDDSLAILQRYAGYPQFHLISQPTRASRRRATGHSRLARPAAVFLDADDFLPPGPSRRMCG